MASLTGTKIKDTYDSLIKVSDNGALDGTLQTLTDGLGNDSALSLSTAGASVTGTLSVSGGITGTLSTAAQPNVTSVGTLSYLSVSGTSTYVATINNSSQDARIELQKSGTQKGQISAGDSSLNLYGVDNLRFLSGGSGLERMRITSGGKVEIGGTTTYGSKLGVINSDSASPVSHFKNNRNLSGDSVMYLELGANARDTSSFYMQCFDSGQDQLYIYGNGNVVNRNNSYGAISDAKLKENVVDASPKLEDLMQVKVRNYNLIGDDKKQLGVVAQELEEVFPSMIDESPDYEERQVEVRDEEGNIVYKTEQVLVSEAVEAVYEEVVHPAEEAVYEEVIHPAEDALYDAEGNVVVPAKEEWIESVLVSEAKEEWIEQVLVSPAVEAVYETITLDEPEMTTERFDLGTVTKSVKYSVFVPMLIKAMQEQQEIIDGLKARIEALESLS